MTHKYIFKTAGQSMAPLIEPGSSLRVDWNWTLCDFGDIIVYFSYRHEALIAHRIIGFTYLNKKKLYLVQGDNVFYDDGWISGNEIVGKVKIVIREDKRVINLTVKRNRILGKLFAWFSRVGISSMQIRKFIFLCMKKNTVPEHGGAIVED